MGFFMEKIYSKYLECTGVSTDTRTIEKGNLFFCLKGENFDGNTFAKKAIELGAKYVMIDNVDYQIEGKTILVENVLKSLQHLANFHRRQLRIPIIGITGSNGKTTTKELTAHLLSQKFNTLSTKGNLNNQIGVPITLLKITKKHEIAVIEMGANHPGDIKDLCEIAEPNYGIICNIGKAHLEGFKNLEGVIETKTALYRSVQQNKGTLFVNIDDNILMNNLPGEGNYIYYSGEDNVKATIKGNLIKLTPFIHLKWSEGVYHSNGIETQIIGEYNFYNLLTAITIANYFGVNSDKINQAIKVYTNENNRSQLKETQKNTLIMDAYNANPSSMNSAINSFVKVDHTSKIMILGDMFELGLESELEHQKLIEKVEETSLPAYFVGERFYEFKNDKNNFFKTKGEFREFLIQNPILKSLILIKGSRGIALETLIDLL